MIQPYFFISWRIFEATLYTDYLTPHRSLIGSTVRALFCHFFLTIIFSVWQETAEYSFKKRKKSKNKDLFFEVNQRDPRRFFKNLQEPFCATSRQFVQIYPCQILYSFFSCKDDALRWAFGLPPGSSSQKLERNWTKLPALSDFTSLCWLLDG